MTLLFAGGGTGGHIFPAIATMRALEIRQHECVLITTPSLKKWKSNRTDVKMEYLSISKNGSVGFLWLFIINFIKSFFLIRKYKPKAIVCFGGRFTAPILMAGYLLRVPIILHESNSVLGKVNKLFLPFAQKLGFFFPSIEENIPNRYEEKLSLVGIPITKDIEYCTYPQITNKIKILVIGGSQGASIFSDIIPNTINKVIDKIKSEIVIYHQCPKQDLHRVEQKYTDYKINAEIATFFHNIAEKLSEAHVIISRAGASTIAEILVMGKPTIYIPYPYAKDSHQLKNAEFIMKNKGGILIKQENLTMENLANELIELINGKNKLQEISEQASKIAINNASVRFAELIEYVITAKSNGGSGKI
ncbi:MAG: undecaprenyldiphospho-muramoylpentapeptide beta-N-acetylglucosaminyltransferase [Rickettsiaceae bacterium H1]|nr:undecaprenyldiphospho-muramoylpentapeptide beta-N-acetylglucosaminyltransferase [Rickettsiaceae bacterium H1]